MKITISILISFLLLISCKSEMGNHSNITDEEDYNWIELIDKDLTNWDTYLSYQHKNSYNGTPPKNDKGEVVNPIGLNNPNFSVFTTFMDGEEIVVKNSGEYYGCLTTKEEFNNYHFQLKFKWGAQKWMPRKDKLMDSGILYHSIGDFGVEYWRSWMLSQEFQIMEGHTGDFWSQATSAIDIRAYKPESNINPLADESQDYLTIGRNSIYKNYCLRSNNYEKPFGEWNTLDLYCFEDKSLHVVNGKVVMILKNSRYLDKNGAYVSLKKGKIQLQSEAAEIFFKDIKIRKITSFTQKQKMLF